MKFASKLKVQIPLALGFSIIANCPMKLPASCAEQFTTPATVVDSISSTAPSLGSPALTNPISTGNIAIQNIYLNESKQLIVEFDNPTHINPLEPQVKDYPGLKHDLVLEFPGVSFAVDKAPKAKTVLDSLTKVYPDLNSIAYATASDGTKARIRLGVSPSVSTHPTLVKIDQDMAVINLDLPDAKTAVVAEDNVSEDNNKVLIKEQSKSQVASANNTMAKHGEGKGIKSKTVSGIKSAWASSLKASHDQVNKLSKISKVNPLSKFGRNNKSNQLSVPVNPNLASGVTAEKETTTRLSEDKKDESTDKLAAVPANDQVSGADSAPAVVATNSETKTEMANLKPEINTTVANEQVTTKTVIAEKLATELSNISPNEEGSKEIPASATAPTISATAESLVTPLSVEQMLKERANLQTVDSNSTAVTENKANPPILSSSSDKAVVSDFKTSFSKPDENAGTEGVSKDGVASKSDSENKKNIAEKASDESKKEEGEKIASVPANPLDTLTSAAISSQANSDTSAEETSQATKEVKLKSQKAHAGGKDYFPPKFSDDAIDHYNAAVRAHLSGKLTEAIAEYKAAIEADEKIGEAYSNLGLIYNQLHKYDQAMVEFHKALAINPKDAITYNGVGAAMRAKNNLLAAIKNWQAAIIIDPSLASAHYNLGTAYELNRDLEKALSQYKEAVKRDDKLGEAYYRMGLILQKMNNKNLALEEYKQAIKISQQASYVNDAKRRITLLSQSKNNSM